MTSGDTSVTRTAGEVADWLRAQGYLQEIKGSADPMSVPIERLVKAESAEPATMAWAGRPELAVAFGGGVLIASVVAAPSAGSDVVVLVCEDPAAAWVDVATALFSHLSADQTALWNDDADRARAEEGHGLGAQRTHRSGSSHRPARVHRHARDDTAPDHE